MTQDLFVSTRKGLFRFQRSGGKWQQTYVAFLGQPVTSFLADPRTGHWYAALCIEQLPESERPYFQDHLAHIILPLQERNGCWWDYPFYNYHQQYGTAMAVMTLVRCQH